MSENKDRLRALLVVLDGAADRPEQELAGKTPLEIAATPSLDHLIGSGVGAMVTVLPEGAVPQTHSGMLSLLGYPEIALRAKRGSLEAAVVFGSVSAESLLARGNLSSLVDGEIPSRRVNRDVSQVEADEICQTLSREIPRLTGIGFRVKSYSTYRLAVELRLEGAPSETISNTDPGYAVNADFVVPDSHARFPLTWSHPLVDDEASKRSAEAVNLVTKTAHEVLDAHPLNVERIRRGQLPINHILLRDFGVGLPLVESFQHRWGLSAKYFHDLPVEQGVARYLGMDDAEAHCKDAKHDSYKSAASAVMLATKDYDFVVFHIKGPDEPGHDGSWAGKVSAIETIDRGFFQEILKSPELPGLTICVTSDHATCWAVGTHTADKVALAIRTPDRPTSVSSLRLTEKDCSVASANMTAAWELLPTILRKSNKKKTID